MVRFGYRKVSMVAPWKVEESRQVRGKEASSVGRSLQGSSLENDDLDEGKASKNAEKKTSQHYFPPGQPEIILRHAEELKMTLVCEKGKADLEDLAILPTQQHQFPKASHPTASSAPTPPTGGDEDIPAARETLRSSSRGGEVHHRAQHLWQAAAKQPPCAPAAVGVMAAEEGTEGRKELSATGSECQAGRWALGQPRLIHWGSWELLLALENGHMEPLASQARLWRTPIPSPEPGAQRSGDCTCRASFLSLISRFLSPSLWRCNMTYITWCSNLWLKAQCGGRPVWEIHEPPHHQTIKEMAQGISCN